jgi:hypothetical protein
MFILGTNFLIEQQKKIARYWISAIRELKRYERVGIILQTLVLCMR